ncbi:MAG: cupin domain-containing protein [Natronospirillum sp.]
MSKFHPDVDVLTEYVAGNLSYHETLMVAVHLHYCPACAKSARELEALGGVLLDDLPGEPVDERLLEETLALLSSEPTVRRAPKSTASYLNPEIPRPLQKAIPNGFDGLTWRKLLPHLQVCDLETSPDGPTITLHRIKPGGRIPKHTHRGTEYTVLLKGGFSDAFGDYNTGDYLCRDASHEHTPVAADNEECICLTAVEAPLRMTSWKWRWLNPFLS